MAIETVLIPAATGVLGIAIGLGASLIKRHKPKEMPAAADKNIWEHLRGITKERADAAAKKKALHRAYAAGSVNEHSFITKDTHYTKLEEQLDEEIDETVIELSKAFLPEELQKEEAKLQELSDLAVLSKQLEELKHNKTELEEEKNNLYLQLAELEEDKQMHLAEKNQLRGKYNSDTKRLDEMTEDISKLEKHRMALEKKVAGIGPRDQKISTLETENRVLRESLVNARKKLIREEKELGVLAAIVDRYSKSIDESRKTDEMKELVQPSNPGVQGLIKQHSDPKAAFEFVRDNILEVHPQISASYWLNIDDVMRLEAADPDDKAIFLCSMVRALGEEATVAMLEMKNSYRRAVVLMSDRILDPTDPNEYDDFTGLSREEAIRK